MEQAFTSGIKAVVERSSDKSGNYSQLNTYSHDLNILYTNSNSWQINEKNIRSDDTG